MKLSKLIRSHKFDYVSILITDDLFPAPKKLRKGYKLFHFDKPISSEDAVEEMEKEGYAPANVYELLSWKDWNKDNYVIALGSVGEVCGIRRVVYLGRGGTERFLNLGHWSGGWYAYDRFLAVRNSTVKLSSSVETSEPLSLGAPCPHCGELVRVRFSK